jgi:hypothetical protein
MIAVAAVIFIISIWIYTLRSFDSERPTKTFRDHFISRVRSRPFYVLRKGCAVTWLYSLSISLFKAFLHVFTKSLAI